MQTRGHGSKRRKYPEAIAALLQAPSVHEAARLAGINPNTLLGWMAEPDFVAQYQDARKAVVDAAIGRMQRLCSKAVQRLEEILDDRDVAPSVTVNACKLVFDTTLKAMEQQQVIERLERLETHLSVAKGP